MQIMRSQPDALLNLWNHYSRESSKAPACSDELRHTHLSGQPVSVRAHVETIVRFTLAYEQRKQPQVNNRRSFRDVLFEAFP